MKFTTSAVTAATLLVNGSCALTTDKASPLSSSIPSKRTVEINTNHTQDVIFNNPLKDGVEQFFTIPVNYGWVKVRVKNKTKTTMTVRVTRDSLTGTQKMLFKVAPGTQRYVTADKSWSTGIFYVAISTKNSVALSGELSVKLANTKNAL